MTGRWVISIDRMTGESDRDAPIDVICVMLCDKLIIEQDIACAKPGGAFVRVGGKRIRDVPPSNEVAAN